MLGGKGGTFHAKLNDYLSPRNATVIEDDVRRYVRANFFLRKLNKCSDSLTILEYKAIRNLALEGKINEAKEMLDDVMGRKAATG